MLSKKSAKLTIFFTEVICMVLEVCASYLFSPYFGSSNYVWTGIIGVILLSNSIGNYIGGRLAQHKDKDYLPMILLLASGFTFMLGVFNDMVCMFTLNIVKDNTFSSLTSSLILLLPSEICLGTIPPQIMTRTTDKSDKDIGLIYMLSTIGGLAGTFIGGYFLIPRIGVNIIVVVCGVILLAFGFTTKFSKKISAAYLFVLIMAILDISMIAISGNRFSMINGTLVFDSEYNRIMIGEAINNDDGKKVRYMQMAQGFESATYTDEDLRYEMVFDYVKAFDTVIDIGNRHRTDTLMIGGAAYQYPKYVLAHYDDVNMDVVEIDSKVTELAKEYFYLQDCIDEFDPNEERLGLINQDAKVYVKNCDKKYDIIYNDAFAGQVPVRTLTTYETMKEIKSCMNDDGLYVINIVGNIEDDDAEFIKAECNTLSRLFSHIYLRPCDESANGLTNYLLIATDVRLDVDSMDFDYSDGVILTDNYCPIDSLLPKGQH